METAAESGPNTASAAANIVQLTKTVSSPTTLYRPLSILHAKSSTSTLAQVGKQPSLNNRHSQLSDSGAESCDADEQTRLIATPTARSHKYIIIPATTAAAAAASSDAATPPAVGTAFRQTISASSLATMATLHRAPLAVPTSASEAAPTPPPSLQRQSPSCNALWRRSVNLPATPAPLSAVAYQPSSTTAAASTPPSTTTTTTTPHATNATVTFTIDDCESDNGIDDPPRATEPAISSINVAPNLAPSSSPSGGASAVTIVGGVAVDMRPRNEQHSSMRSVVSAYIPSSAEAAALNPHHTFPFQLSGEQPPAMASYGKDLNSYLFHDHVANQIYSDVTSVRSLASIGIGSTDGRRLVIRRVPHSPDELFSLVHPPSPPPLGDDDDDDDSFMDMSDATANLKPRQQHWGNKMQFVLACIGYSVGLGNVWRFPYMCYKSGGGVFLVPYCIILFVCSIPLLFMELSVGQYTGRGPIGALGQLCPLFKGAGVASVVVSFLMSTYYSVIIGYSIYYFFTSFKPYMPWIDCNNRWNTPDCWVPQRPEANMTSPPTSRTPSEEFFENKVLQISPGIEYPGQMRWELFACLICAWLMVYFATWKSIKSSAKVRYFTATFPFVLIIILMGRAVTLEGADDGLRYFFRPNWSELKNANVWINAASQNFNSLGITFGSMISFASYNKYNNNIVRDTIAVSVVNILTSLLVGVFAFATLGNLALEQNTNVRDVIGDGPGLIFVVYPQAMAKMPYAQLWAVMFFFMLLCLGLNSQFAIVEVVVTSIQDGFPNWIKRHLGYHEIVVLIVCIVSFLFGLPNLIQGGIYFFQLMDHYAASVTIMFLAFCQMIAIAWFYGTGRLSKNIKQMTGKAPSLYFKSCWLLLGPSLLFAIWILSLINYKEPTYHNGRYKYPEWAYGIGWMFASFSLVCIPGYAIINLMRSTGDTFWERIRNTLRPNIYECKICNEHHCEHDYPEQEQFMLAQEMSTVYKPAPQVQPTAPLPFAMSQRSGYNSMQQQQQQHQSTIHHPEFTYQRDDDPTQQQQQQQQPHTNYEPPSTSAGGAAGPR